MIHPPTVRALMALARAKAADPIASQAQVLTALTEWFASPTAITATDLPPELIDALVNIGIDHKAALVAADRVLSKPMTGRSRHGAPAPLPNMTATRRIASEEPEMRAMFLLASARRLTQALIDGAYTQALENEQRFLDMHVAAGRNRRKAARRVDDIARDGQVLVWRAVMDDRTTPDCAALDGRLFTADHPPGGVYPGAKHIRCRCRASAWGSPGTALFA